MTGAYLRVDRNGKWESIEVEHLTDDERRKIFKNDDFLINWFNLVCARLSGVESLLDDLEKEGILEKK